MLIGLGGKKTDTAGSAGSAHSFDVSAEDFEAKVIAPSMTVPVLVDFWAPWCGPCKQLMPVLEQLVAEAGGKILLAKVNIDTNQQLAQALRVQSVPTVYAFFQGQPVTAFAGARPQSELKALFDQLIRMAGQAAPEAIDVPATLAEAAAKLAAGEIAEAQVLYASVMEQDQENAPAYAGLVRTMIAAGDLAEARAMIDEAPEAMAADPAFMAAKTAVELAENRPDDSVLSQLRKAAENPGGLDARFDLAVALFAAGQPAEAIDILLDLVRQDREWEDGKARRQLLDFFQALGPADAAVMAARRRLSSLLFS